MIASWFSAGCSSFVAAYIMRDEIDRVVFIDVANQHPDTYRFLADCESVLGMEIDIICDFKFGASVDEVIERKRYINGVAGAPCTLELKKRVRQEWERQFAEPITYVWGFDADERARADRLEAGMVEFSHRFPLIERGLTKKDVHAICAELGIKRPAMYDMGYPNNNCIGCVKGGMGYPNNNCIGCVKGGMGYWNAIRRDFPDVFERRARQEREIGHSCIKGVFLDELEPNRGRMDEVMPECSFACLGVA